MKIAVTGASGFIGRHVVSAATAAWHEVVAPNRQNADNPDFWRMFTGCDVVCHLAAYVPDLMADMHPQTFRDCFEGNVLFTTKVLRASELAGVKRFVNFGTGQAYAVHCDYPDESAPLYPTSRATPYLESKVAQEIVVAGWRGLETCTLRLGSVYGRGQTKGLVASLTRRMLRGHTIVLETGGAFGADYVNVYDVAQVAVRACESDVTGAVNIASGRRVTIRKLVEILGDIIACRSEIVVNSCDSVRYCGFPALNINRAIREFGFACQLLRPGLEQYVEWFREHGDDNARQYASGSADRAADVPAA